MQTFTLEDFSRHRAGLMGFAMLLVVFFHFGFYYPPLHYLFNYGYIGVDIFMFLSGMGLFYSMTKDNNTFSFYRKRLLRIYPVYIFMGVFFSVFCQHDSLGRYLWKCTTLGFWTGGENLVDYFEWFVPSILGCYFVFPWLYKYIFCSRRDIRLWLLMTIILLVIITCNQWHFISFPYDLLLMRLPIFLLGAFSAKCIIEKKNFSPIVVKISIVGGLFFLLVYLAKIAGYNYIYGRFCTLSVCSAAPLLMIIATRRIVVPFIDKMAVIGRASLEIYLIHVCVSFSGFLKQDFITRLPSLYILIVFLFVAIVCILLGILLHTLIAKIIDRL